MKKYSEQEEILYKLLKFYCDNTSISIALLNSNEDKNLIPPSSAKNSSELCKMIWKTDFGVRKCAEDQEYRARTIDSRSIIACHAGVLNIHIPIIYNGEKLYLLSCGQFLSNKSPYHRESESNFENFISALKSLSICDKEYEKALRDTYNYCQINLIEDYERKINDLSSKLSSIAIWLKWANEQVNILKIEREQIQLKKSETDFSLKNLLHEMIEPIQRIYDFINLIYSNLTAKTDDSTKKRQLRSDMTILKKELISATRQFQSAHENFIKDSKIFLDKYEHPEIKPDIDLEIIGALLDLYSEQTNSPIGFFDLVGAKRVILTEYSFSKFSNYCINIWTKLADGKDKCNKDHVSRAEKIIEENVTLCHAGLFNYGMPIMIDGRKVACVLFGQKKLRQNSIFDNGENKHKEFIQKLSPNLSLFESNAEIIDLQNSYKQIERTSFRKDQVRNIRTFTKIYEWMFKNNDEIFNMDLDRRKLLYDYKLLIDDEYQLNHDIGLSFQAINDIYQWFDDEWKKGILFLESELQYSLEDIIDILDSMRHQIWFSSAASSVWQKGKNKFDIISLIEACLNELSRSAEAKNIFFKKSLPKYGVFCYANYYEMRVALWNVIQNAIKYSHRGYKRISGYNIKINVDYNDNEVCISIENFGIGILEYEFDLIYQSGQRGKLAKKERPQGTGQGLSITKRLLEKNGWKIRHTSREVSKDRYLTTFYITKKIKRGG